jgi:ribosomal protein S17E
VEIIDNDARRKAHIGGQSGLPLSYFTWNRKFIESCQADNLRQLDLDTYFSLKSSISKRLYRFLGKRFYLQADWTFGLNEIAFDRVGLSRNYEYNAGKIKEKLQTAIDELEAIGFLRPLGREERYSRIDRGRWTIRLVRQPPTLVAPQQTPLPSVEPEPPRLATELTRRGVTKATAAELVQRYPAEQIEHKLEVFDWLTEKQDKRIAKSPAGYLVTSIEKDFAASKGFVSKAERQRQQAAERQAEQLAAEDHRRQQQADARQRAEAEQIEAFWNALTPEQQATLDADSLVLADPDILAMEKGPLKRIGRRIRRHAYIRRRLQEQGKLPAGE